MWIKGKKLALWLIRLQFPMKLNLLWHAMHPRLPSSPNLGDRYA